MKYPYILYLRDAKYAHFDNFFLTNSESLDCTIYIIQDPKDATKIFNSNYHFIAIYAPDDESRTSLTKSLTQLLPDRIFAHQFIDLSMLTFSMGSSVHTLPNIHAFNQVVNTRYAQLCALPREHTRPEFSLFTPSFKSFEKIKRAYSTIQAQTNKDWEWIILDDSPDDEHFSFLRSLLLDNPQVRLFRRGENSGCIGNVKNEASSLCRGKYIFEMDHDDEIIPTLLEEMHRLFTENPDVGFAYADCTNIRESGGNFWYGDGICKGYGGYYMQHVKGAWRYIYMTPNINNITLSHLVCCPNHPRIWRRDVFEEIGGYCEFLPICDDYEILLRTGVKTRMGKINKLAYIQYMNDGDNNFSLIRNAEINRIGPNYLSPVYYGELKMHEHMETVCAKEDLRWMHGNTGIWRRDPVTYENKYSNVIANYDYDCQYCVLGVDALMCNADKLAKLAENPRNDFFVLDNMCSHEYLCQKIDEYGFSARMKCYALKGATRDELLRYFEMLYRTPSIRSEVIEMVVPNRPAINISPEWNRWDVINSLVQNNESTRYLEIGVETGETFKHVRCMEKVGVDPDTKCRVEGGVIYHLTSDAFFERFKIKNVNQDMPKFTHIFVDGMHHSDCVLRDVYNSIMHVAKGGWILIDDAIPMNYREQLRVPVKHYYDNGILKYGEPWTGDVWKAIQFLLSKKEELFSDVKYFYNGNFRGIIAFQVKPEVIDRFVDNTSCADVTTNEIQQMNELDYCRDFNMYCYQLTRVCL